MVTKKEGFVVLWPVYFDKSLSRSRGRKVRRNAAVNSPQVENIAKVVKDLKLKYRIEPDAIHPSRPWKATGRVLVRSEVEKTKLVKWVAKRLK